jgi:MFS family permease
MPSWRTRDVWAISGSACLADLGYQSVLAGFPIFLVLVLHQPVWLFGLASALSYGGGAVFSWVGGRLGDRIGHRKLALMGNAAIPLLSLSALVASPAVAIGLLSGGWWARNLRSPSRRVMLTEAVPREEDRAPAFGFLHALDIGGGVLAAVYVLIALGSHLQFRWLFLATAIPLAMSTALLSRAGTGRGAGRRVKPATSSPGSPDPSGGTPTGAVTASPEVSGSASMGVTERRLPGAKALLAATALYGFTSYSVGFPVLTLAQASHRSLVGIAAFLVFQAVSALTGFFLGSRLGRSVSEHFRNLALLGYMTAGAGAALMAVGYATGLGAGVLMLAVAIIGFALGIVETLEPSVMSVLRPGAASGRGFGALSAYRSVGVFVGNLAMGLLYGVSASWAYGYAAAVAVGAAVVILAVVPAVTRAERVMPVPGH